MQKKRLEEALNAGKLIKLGTFYMWCQIWKSFKYFSIQKKALI